MAALCMQDCKHTPQLQREMTPSSPAWMRWRSWSMSGLRRASVTAGLPLRSVSSPWSAALRGRRPGLRSSRVGGLGGNAGGAPGNFARMPRSSRMRGDRGKRSPSIARFRKLTAPPLPRRSDRAAYPALTQESPIKPSALRSSILRADPDGRLGSPGVPRDAIFPFEHRQTDTTSQPEAAFGRSLDNARHRAQSLPAS